MKSSPINLFTMSFLVLVLVGITLIVLSFLSSFRSYDNGRIVRAGGFALLFFGIGEYLNHQPLIEHSPEPQDKNKTARPAGRWRRTPCGLGNLFDVLAIISVFIAASYVLFSGK